MQKKHVFALLGAALCSGAFLYWQDNGITVSSMIYEGEIPKPFDGCRILQVSDLQNKVFGKDQEPLLRKMEYSAPDLIFITGDLLDRNRTNVDTAMSFIARAAELAPVYFVSGNHEHQSGEWECLSELLTAEGVTVLDNGRSVIEKDGACLTLLGLADKKRNPYFRSVLHTLTAGQDPDAFLILLSHRPELFEEYAEAGVDLVFSGHAHGGQIRLPFIGGLFAPHQGFFPKYTAGSFHKGHTTMFVSRGLGNSTFPFRIFNRPELVEVTLRQKN